MAFSPARQYTAASSQYHKITDAAQSGLDVNGLNPFYSAFWVFSPSIAPGVSNRTIAGKGDGTSDRSWGLLYHNGADRFRFLATHDGATNSVADWGSAPAQNTWYFVEIYYDGVSLIGICVTAEGAGSRSGTDVTANLLLGLWNSAQDFEIGRGYGNPVWDGRIQGGVYISGAIPTAGDRNNLWNTDRGVLYANRPTLSSGTYVSLWNGDEASGNLIDGFGTNNLTDVNGVTTNTGHIVIPTSSVKPRMMLLGVG